MRIKTGGRKKNTPNKMTSEIKEIIQSIVSNQLESINADIQTLSIDKQIEFTIKLLPFILPKKNTYDIEDKEKIEVVFVKGKTIL
jgi:hypothetical protein